MKLKFGSGLDYQLEDISSATDLFERLPLCAIAVTRYALRYLRILLGCPF
ncbi:MAG: hypothetical protein IT392_01550 [Nitrospirae bacterium]|nr:hypothetical protein [Nitrospirota bacterium]